MEFVKKSIISFGELIFIYISVPNSFIIKFLKVVLNNSSVPVSGWVSLNTVWTKSGITRPNISFIFPSSSDILTGL